MYTVLQPQCALYTRPCGKKGKGLFTKCAIPAMAVVGTLRGKLVEEGDSASKFRYLGCDKKIYDASKRKNNMLKYCNHSCQVEYLHILQYEIK